MPKLPGVYFFKNAHGVVIYVGKAKSLRDRVSSYFQNPNKLLPKTARLVADIVKIDYQVTESEIDALLLEANYIRKLAPKYNVNWKDGKAYPLIEITTREAVPLVRIRHHETDSRARYFGPYPSGSDLLSLMGYLRRIFPYVSQKHAGNKPCLRSHLGLCPCQDLSDYRRDLNNLIHFLNGQRQFVQKRLEREMMTAAKKENFEAAAEIKAKLEKLSLIAAKRAQPWEYEVNPNLAADRRRAELKDLERILKITKISKIEGYDISNTSGRSATGAQVVFIDGVPEKKLYRRYKIKLKDTPDDYAMLTEVLNRRLKSSVSLPDLLVIDGGRGQVDAIASLQHDVMTIGLAKRLEAVVLVGGREIQLPLNSPALHLLQRLRDEAHRFSRKYHFYLRSRKMLS